MQSLDCGLTKLNFPESDELKSNAQTSLPVILIQKKKDDQCQQDLCPQAVDSVQKVPLSLEPIFLPPESEAEAKRYQCTKSTDSFLVSTWHLSTDGPENGWIIRRRF